MRPSAGTALRTLGPCGPCDMSVQIEYLDADMIVAVKPGGLLSVPGRGPDKQDCLIARLQGLHADALIVHRLDMATSGLMVLARGAEMQRRLSAAFQARQVGKRYVAVVSGLLDAPHSLWGQIDLPLMTDWPNRPRQKVSLDAGKPSLTRYRLLSHDHRAGTSRVELEPLTGRTHQLRVHLMSLGHPIVGDTLYASEAHSGQGLASRLLLHATELELTHPASGELLRFCSPAPF